MPPGDPIQFHAWEKEGGSNLNRAKRPIPIGVRLGGRAVSPGAQARPIAGLQRARTVPVMNALVEASERQRKLDRGAGMPGAGLTVRRSRRVPSDRLVLEPLLGKTHRTES